MRVYVKTRLRVQKPYHYLSSNVLPQEGQTATEDQVVDSAKESVKGLVPCSPVPPAVTDCTEPVDTDSDTTKAKDTEASTAKINDEKPSSPKTITSDSSPSCPSSSYPASSSCADLIQKKEIKDEDIKEEKHDKDVKKGSISEEKMEVDFVKVETKKEKTDVRQTTKPPRPSSTPPSNTGMRVDFVPDSFRVIASYW